MADTGGTIRLQTNARNPPGDFSQPQDRPGEGLSGMEGASGLSHQDAGEGGAPKDILSQGSVDSGDSGSRDIGPESHRPRRKAIGWQR